MWPATARSPTRGQMQSLEHPLVISAWHHCFIYLFMYLFIYSVHTPEHTCVSLFSSCTRTRPGHAKVAMTQHRSCRKPRAIEEAGAGAALTEEGEGGSSLRTQFILLCSMDSGKGLFSLPSCMHCCRSDGRRKDSQGLLPRRTLLRAWGVSSWNLGTAWKSSTSWKMDSIDHFFLDTLHFRLILLCN